MLAREPALLQSICNVYMQDFVCLGYELPAGCELLPRAAANGIKHAKYQADNLLQDGTYLDAERQQELMRKNQRKKYPVQLPVCVTVGSDRHCRKEAKKAPAKPKRADAATEAASRRWRGAPEMRFPRG